MTSVPLCKCTAWFMLNTITGQVGPYRHKSWSCPVHRQAYAWSWAFRVARAGPQRMVTLTNIPKDQDTARKGFSSLVRDLRALGIPFEYVRFFEVGSRNGMYHYHLGQRGDFVPQKLLSDRAAANGLGKIVDVRSCHGAGPGWYMAKYIGKGLDEMPPGWRKVAASRGFWPPKGPLESPEPGWVLVKGPADLKRALRAL